MSTYLIVEDDILHRNFLREVVINSELECTQLIEAADGEEAIRLVREYAPKGIVRNNFV